MLYILAKSPLLKAWSQNNKEKKNKQSTNCPIDSRKGIIIFQRLYLINYHTMTARLDHRLFADQLPSLSMPLDFDMDTNILNMDWLGNLSTRDSLPWDPPAPVRSYGYNLAYDYKSDDLDELLDLDQPKAFAISADSDDYINLEDILSSIAPGSVCRPRCTWFEYFEFRHADFLLQGCSLYPEVLVRAEHRPVRDSRQEQPRIRRYRFQITEKDAP
jgi:hypothetical protein